MEILKGSVPKHIYQRLELVDIKSLDYFFTNSKTEIRNKTKFSVNEINNLISVVSKIVLNHNFRTALDLKNEPKNSLVLHTSCPILDKTIHGIPTKGVTEIYGESSAGKTQIALSLALQVQNSIEFGGLGAGAIYVCTEDIFPSKRLQQLCQLLPDENNKYTDSIYVENVKEIDQFKHCITIRIPVLLSRTNIKLIIIDSIAAIFRYNNETSDFITRSEDLRLIASKLNSLSSQYNLAVLCINQVTSDPTTGLKPCLGLAWSNLVRKRIAVSRTNKKIVIENQILPVRYLKVIFSPDTPRNSCNFIINKSGVKGYT